MTYSIQYTETAVRDLTETVEYIDHVLLNPDVADHLLDELDNKLTYLAEYPYAHPVVDDPFLKNQSIHFTLINHYLAFYIIDDDDHKTVHIIRFVHFQRDWITVVNYPALKCQA